MRHLLQISDLDPIEIDRILDVATWFKGAPRGQSDLLRDDTVVLYFAKPSTRTRLSFATAVGRLGGNPAVVGPDELQLGRGETIEDTTRVVSRFARAFVIRTFAQSDLERCAAASTIPVVNALTDEHHPCQALADLMTLADHFGQLAGLRVSYVGDGNNVAHSLIEAGASMGMHITVATPPAYAPDDAIVRRAAAVADERGGSIAIVEDPLVGVKGADAVYTDVWTSMGDPESERSTRERVLTPYRVDAALMREASSHAVFLHCLPAHRGQEVAAEVIDGPRSLVFDQAENRLHTAQAVLQWCLTNGTAPEEPC